jgi:hypothetical protein
MKIQYAIVGFVVGIMTGLLLGVLEMKLVSGTNRSTILPFIILVTVITCIIIGVRTAIKMANKKLKE